MRFFTFLIFLSFTLFLNAQDGIHKEKSIGVRAAIPFVNEFLPEGRTYIPYKLMGYYSFANLAKKKRNNFWVYLEPQLAFIAYDPKDPLDIEFGANLGFRYEWTLGDFSLLTLGISSGPHYISVETDHQTKGFIFSDNMEIGIRKLLKSSPWEIQAHLRFRHISNADLFLPNLGIDTWFIVIGASKRI